MTKYGAVSVDRLSTIMRTILRQLHKLGEDGPVALTNGLTVGGEWKVLKKLGEGGCGAVYMVENVKDLRKAALKAESNFVEGGSVLKLEYNYGNQILPYAQILTKLKGKKHVPELIHAGKKEKYQYMVMSLLGDSLCDVLKSCGKQLTISTQLRLGVHVLHGLKQIHDSGFVHRDIKPANLALGNRDGGTDPNFIYVLDFGLSRSFVVEEEGVQVLRKPRKHALFRYCRILSSDGHPIRSNDQYRGFGTTRYCSADANEKKDQGRVDDLWSMLYVMVELRGKLPWSNLHDKKELAAAKRAVDDNTLFSKCPNQLRDFAAHLRILDYWTRPDYLLLYKSLTDGMTEGGYKFSDPWDWQGKIKDGSSKGSSLKSLSLKRNKSSKGVKKSAKDKTTDLPDEHPFNDDDFATNPLGF
ncbi:hypothetical protein PRIPAC_92347 [Pristionchus pacificus]|uniref:Protein kinase domain-containing protein n=1 Tax=Pristionchus pacificus TaxID=54126 RepID=A0A2A6C9B4_PRIPA|nr:hypothetical protein PRIPAC_92347 [Pristionchus pacificus]|eukprot:PDM74774.1 protein kinase [Pristionchus pacificus]